jgi:TPR repeat protein
MADAKRSGLLCKSRCGDAPRTSASRTLSFHLCGLTKWRGLLLSQDKPAAVMYLRRASDMGLAAALCWYADALDKRTGIEQDEKAAFRSMKRAADMGHCQYRSEGVGCAPNAAEAFRLASASALQGWAPAFALLGHYYLVGHGTSSDWEKAVDWRSRAEKHGIVD